MLSATRCNKLLRELEVTAQRQSPRIFARTTAGN